MQVQATPRVVASTAAAWFGLAVLYLLAGVVLGIVMGATEDFTLRSVHSHVTQLGWTTLALAGLIYQVFPQARASRLSKVHFCLYNLALLPLMLSLGALQLGHSAAKPILVVSQIVLAGGLLAFVANVILNVKRSAR